MTSEIVINNAFFLKLVLDIACKGSCKHLTRRCPVAVAKLAPRSTTRLQVTEHEGALHTCSATPSCPDTADLLQLSATVEVSQLMGGCYSELPNYKSSVCCSQTVLHSRFISDCTEVQVRFLLCLLLHCSHGYGASRNEGSPILRLQA